MNARPSLADQVIHRIDQAAGLYFRLVLVVGPNDSGKTAALRDVQRRTGYPYINVGLELSHRLLDRTIRDRVFEVSQALERLAREHESRVILIDNNEILFTPALQQDPLRLLQQAARNRTVVAAWNGKVAGDSLTYAEADHPEHRRYATDGLLLVGPEVSTQMP
ncbi:MAG TPA: BREX-3 system P-loop-containing protein BrxF [Chloroflexota bacterium]|nr:BREX-3 system P-loop-containing protein BrxF [Chloroflexota bacterium]